MKRMIALGSMLGVFVILSGCVGSDADDLTKNQIRIMNEFAEAIETNAPESKMNDLKKRADDNGKKMDNLKLSEDEMKKLKDRHKDDFEKASVRLQKALMTKLGQGGQFPFPLPGKKG